MGDTRRFNDPIAVVADGIVDDLRAREIAARPAEPIAWITQHGDLFCARCVQPTIAQREDWLVVQPGANGKPDACDLCGKLVTP